MIPMRRLQDLAEIVGTEDERVQRIMSRAMKWPESRPSGESLLLRLANAKRRSVGIPATYPIPDDIPDEGLMVGMCLNGSEVSDVERRLRPETLCQHLLIGGATGSGKTRFAGLLVRQLVDRGIKVIIFDSCGDYLGMIGELPVEDLLVFRGRETPMNPFEVPCPGEMDPLDWLEKTASLYWETQFIRAGSGGLLTDIVGREYFKRGVFDGSGDFPTFGDVYRAVLDRKYSARQQRHAGWAETLRHRFGMLLRHLGAGLCVKRSVRPEDLVSHSVIFDVQGLRGMSLDFLVGHVVLRLRSYLEVHPEVSAAGVVPLVVVVLEEAHRMLSQGKEKRQDLEEPILVEATRMVRGLSMGLIAIDQSPGTMPEAALANMGAVALMRLTSKKSIYGVGDARGLSGEQIWQLPRLTTRQAVVQCVDVTEPCLVQIPLFEGWERSPQDEVRARVAASMERVGCENAGDEVRRLLGLTSDEETKQTDKPTLGGDELRVLAHICRGPELIEQRCEDLQMNRSQEGRVRRNLEKLRLIQEADKLGKWVLYEPTDKGRAAAKKRGFDVTRFKGGTAHEFMVRRVREAVGTFSTRISFVAAGEGLGVGSVQPDLIARVRDSRGDMSRVVAFQCCSKNKQRYEIQKTKELTEIEHVDAVVLITRDKGSRDRLVEGLEREGILNVTADEGSPPAVSLPMGVRVLDVQSAIGGAEKWGWLLA